MTQTPIPLLRSAIYGDDDELDDPAELFHEASRLYPALSERQGAGIERLLRSEPLREAAARPVRVNPQRDAVPLAAVELPVCSLREAIERRRSRPPDPGPPLTLETLARLVVAGYGEAAGGRRTVPSGGGLYPLELYVVALRVDGLPAAVYHLDPLTPALEIVEPGDHREELCRALPLADLVEHATAALFLTATFWRSRFKYGLRGYRFALLEAGHAAQNVVLAAAAADVSALPLGGFYDALVERMLGADGVDESVLYGMVLGSEGQ